MYNSEENLAYDDNRNTQSQPVSVNNEQKPGRLNNSRPKNVPNIVNRNNGISGTYARIVPKKPLHDLQRLYAENMQLREKIKFLQQDNTKIKTRVSMAEREKQQLLNQLANSDYGNNALKDRRPSLKGIRKNQQKSNKTSFDQNRRILHSHKDQISKLQLENGRLKKTVKYTQIKELETENQLLHEQMGRMKRYVQDALDSLQYDQYQKQIEQLRKQIQGEKDSSKSLHMQLKKKDQEIEEIKNKMRIIMNRKSQLQKKYNRDISNVKGELYRVKQKQKQLHEGNESHQNSKQKRTNSTVSCKNCQKYNDLLQKQKNKTLTLQDQLVQKNKEISELKNKIKQVQKRNNHQQSLGSNKQKDSGSNFILKQEKNQNQEKRSIQPQKGEKNSQKPVSNNSGVTKHQIQKQQKQVEQKQSQDQQQYDQDQEQDHYEDKVDVFHVDLSEKKNTKGKEIEKQKNQSHEQHEQHEQQQQQYGNEQFNDIQEHKKQFNEESQEQEVLFQKQQQTIKKPQNSQNITKVQQQPQKKKTKPKQMQKGKQKQKQKEKQKAKEKQKQKQKIGLSKAEKILKESIKYRLIAQRYTFADFKRDIIDSEVKQFDVETLVQMLTNQPFFLGEDHLQMVMYAIFRRQQIQGTDTVAKGQFLKIMKGLIQDFKLKQQAEEQKILLTIKKKLKGQKIFMQMQQESIDGKSISKKSFMKVLKQTGGLTDIQIQQCLAQASVLSIDIAHINYQKFLQKIASIHK